MPNDLQGPLVLDDQRDVRNVIALLRPPWVRLAESTSSSSSPCSESESSSKKDGRDSVVMLNGSGTGWHGGKGAKETVVVVVGCVKRVWVVAACRFLLRPGS